MKPGQPILLLVEDKGRFKKINITEWLDNYCISVETIHTDDKEAANIAVDLIQQRKQ